MSDAVLVKVVGSSGNPAMCYLCGKPAVTFINTSANMASSTPSHMEPVCEQHDPYKLRDVVIVQRLKWDAMSDVATAAHAFVEHHQKGQPGTPGSLYPMTYAQLDQWHDELDKQLAALIEAVAGLES